MSEKCRILASDVAWLLDTSDKISDTATADLYRRAWLNAFAQGVELRAYVSLDDIKLVLENGKIVCQENNIPYSEDVATRLSLEVKKSLGPRYYALNFYGDAWVMTHGNAGLWVQTPGETSVCRGSEVFGSHEHSTGGWSQYVLACRLINLLISTGQALPGDTVTLEAWTDGLDVRSLAFVPVMMRSVAVDVPSNVQLLSQRALGVSDPGLGTLGFETAFGVSK